MNRTLLLAGILAVAVVVSGVRAEDKDKKEEKKPTIKAIMKMSHGKTAFQGKVSAALKEKDFKEADKIAKAWVKSAEALAASTPKKGDEESWKKLTTTYVKTVKTLESAAAKEDGKSAAGALGKIGSTCGGCHKLHK